jgi:hypothetical protein
MIKISDEVWEKLTKGSDHLTEKYGAPGTKSREEFHARAMRYHDAVLAGEDVTDL